MYFVGKKTAEMLTNDQDRWKRMKEQLHEEYVLNIKIQQKRSLID